MVNATIHSVAGSPVSSSLSDQTQWDTSILLLYPTVILPDTVSFCAITQDCTAGINQPAG